MMTKSTEHSSNDNNTTTGESKTNHSTHLPESGTSVITTESSVARNNTATILSQHQDQPSYHNVVSTVPDQYISRASQNVNLYNPNVQTQQFSAQQFSAPTTQISPITHLQPQFQAQQQQIHQNITQNHQISQSHQISQNLDFYSQNIVHPSVLQNYDLQSNPYLHQENATRGNYLDISNNQLHYQNNGGSSFYQQQNTKNSLFPAADQIYPNVYGNSYPPQQIQQPQISTPVVPCPSVVKKEQVELETVKTKEVEGIKSKDESVVKEDSGSSPEQKEGGSKRGKRVNNRGKPPYSYGKMSFSLNMAHFHVLTKILFSRRFLTILSFSCSSH